MKFSMMFNRKVSSRFQKTGNVEGKDSGGRITNQLEKFVVGLSSVSGWVWTRMKPYLTVNPEIRESILDENYRHPSPASQINDTITRDLASSVRQSPEPKTYEDRPYFQRDARRSIDPPVEIKHPILADPNEPAWPLPKPPGPGLHKWKLAAEQPPSDGFFPIRNVS